MQILSIGWNGLQHDAVMHTLVFCKDAVHRHRGEHPVLDGILLQHIGIVDVIAESVLLVALDDDAEHVQNSITVAVEGAAGNGHALARLRLKPATVDLFERYLPGLVDGVYQPDVFLKECVRFHVRCFLNK